MVERARRHPLVMLCTGEHCGPRLAGDAGQGAGEQLRAAVRASVGGLLLTTGCMRRCARGGGRVAPVAAVAWRDDPNATTAGDVLVFAGIDEPTTARSLAEWIQTEPARADDALGSLPLALRSRLIA